MPDMRSWVFPFIWKVSQVTPQPLQKPVRLQMAEDMRDYTEDEKGHIARVDFDFVIDEP